MLTELEFAERRKRDRLASIHYGCHLLFAICHLPWVTGCGRVSKLEASCQRAQRDQGTPKQHSLLLRSLLRACEVRGSACSVRNLDLLLEPKPLTRVPGRSRHRKQADKTISCSPQPGYQGGCTGSPWGFKQSNRSLGLVESQATRWKNV